MDIFLLIIGIILIIIGFLGCLLPVLPGPPLNYLALILLHFTRFADFEASVFIYLGILTAIVQVLDYVVPIWGAKKFGGSTSGTWGSIIGLIAGLLFLPAIGPFGVITILGGPFAGAYIGEKFAGRDNQTALKAAFGTFIGFLTGTLMKFVCAGIITFYFFRELIRYI
jgi:uncharacterized protein YqgC (DUF456 family)